VSGFAANAVSVVDTASNAVIANVPTGVQPLGMALDRSRGRLFVANYEGASVTVIGAVSNTVLGTVPVGQRPFGVVTDPVRSRVYVTNASSDSVSIVDAGNVGSAGTIAEVGRAPFGIGLDLTGARAFVANAGEANVAVIDTSSLAVSSKVAAGQQPIAFGSFLAPMASDCPLPAPVCTDGDPTTSETCSAVDGCQYAVRAAGGTLANALQTIGETIAGAGGSLGTVKSALEQQLENATGQVTPTIGTLATDRVHANAKPPAAARKRLKRIDRALAKFIKVLQKGLRKRTIQRDIGFRLLDLARTAQAATQAALGGKAVVTPSNGLLTPLPLSASRAARPRPPLP
jgi:YVTN family beta-propeller protein